MLEPFAELERRPVRYKRIKGQPRRDRNLVGRQGLEP
jgi:hypothetical protein